MNKIAMIHALVCMDYIGCIAALVIRRKYIQRMQYILIDFGWALDKVLIVNAIKTQDR